MSHADKKRRADLMRRGELLFGPTVTNADRFEDDWDGTCSVPLSKSRFAPLRRFVKRIARAKRLLSACEIHDKEAMIVRRKVTEGLYEAWGREWRKDVLVANENLEENIKLILPCGVRWVYAKAYRIAVGIGKASFAPGRGPAGKLAPEVDEDRPGLVLN